MVGALDPTPGTLPLLPFTAARLWGLRDPGRRLLTEASDERLGGVAGALATHADAVLAGMEGAVTVPMSVDGIFEQRRWKPWKPWAVIASGVVVGMMGAGLDGRPGARVPQPAARVSHRGPRQRTVELVPMASPDTAGVSARFRF